MGSEHVILGAGDAIIKRGKVLVIDDEPSIVELFTDYLHGQGFDVISAGGGEEGLDRLRLDSPDIVLLDMRMPELDGLETLRRIRKVNLRVPVLMVSGNDDIAAARRDRALGAFDYTLKPVDFSTTSAGRSTRCSPSSCRPPSRLHLGGATTGSAHGLLYDLALEVFRTTRRCRRARASRSRRRSKSAALSLVQRGAADRPRRALLNVIRRSCASPRTSGPHRRGASSHLETLHRPSARRSVACRNCP